MSIAHRYAVVIATLACTALLIVGTGCSSCFNNPATTERKGPELMLNLVDLLNSKNNLKNIPAQRYNGSVPPLSLNEANYNYLFFIVATDPGGISSFDYSESGWNGSDLAVRDHQCLGESGENGRRLPQQLRGQRAGYIHDQGEGDESFRQEDRSHLDHQYLLKAVRDTIASDITASPSAAAASS